MTSRLVEFAFDALDLQPSDSSRHVEGRRAAVKIRSFIDFAAERLRQTAVLSWRF
jgi:hypothetical protein